MPEALAANKATNIHHKVPVVTNKQPRNKNDKILSLLSVATNCGSNARKKPKGFVFQA